MTPAIDQFCMISYNHHVRINLNLHLYPTENVEWDKDAYAGFFLLSKLSFDTRVRSMKQCYTFHNVGILVLHFVESLGIGKRNNVVLDGNV